MTLGGDLLRTHAALVLFRSRLIGDPSDRQPANYEHSCRQGQGDGGGVELEGGLSENIAHSVDIGQGMAREKAVYLDERVRLLQQHARQRATFETLRQRRAEVQVQRQVWALSRLTRRGEDCAEGGERGGDGGGDADSDYAGTSAIFGPFVPVMQEVHLYR